MRFIAFWDKGRQHVNLKIDGYTVEECIVHLMKVKDGKNVVIGFFDMGFMDAWYVTEEKA